MLPYLCQLISSLAAKSSLHVSSSTFQSRANFVWRSNVDPLLWLDAQSLYPKCYWQSRDGKEEVLALGQIAQFIDTTHAELSLKGAQRLWGGQAFNHQSYFFLPLFELVRQEKTWSIRINACQNTQQWQNAFALLTFQPTSELHQEAKIIEKKHCPDFEQWTSMVRHALNEIDNTDLQKTVLARKTTIKLKQKISAAALLYKSRQINENHFHFLLAIDEKQSFIGSTPERLFKRKNESFYTEALAGTIGRGLSSHEDSLLANWLLSDEKSLFENQLVVDDIVERLSSFCDLHISTKPKVITLRHILHLKRRIKAKIIDHNIDTDIISSILLDALQPTAAIAGFPRKQALAHILRNEPFDREWYSGSVGFMGEFDAEFCVAIRSALISEKQINFYAGAGIVPGSVACLEWSELDKKLATLLDIIDQSETEQGLKA